MGVKLKETETHKIIGGNIRFLRLRQNLTQTKLAHMIGMDRSFLVGVEAGKRNISVDQLEKLAIALEAPLFTLFLSPANKELYEYFYISTDADINLALQ